MFLGWWICLSLLAALGWFKPLSGQVQETRFRPLSIEEGLSQSTVRAILQDSKGFMWFATQEGLNRFDGHDVEIFDADARNPNSLSGTSLYSLVEGANSTIWVGSEEGLTRFDGLTDTFQRFRHDPQDPGSLSNNFIRDLLLDADGFLWIATSGGGINVLDPSGTQLEVLRHDPEDRAASLSDDHVYELAQDRSGRIWVGTAAGLDQLDPTTRTFRHFQNDPNNPATLTEGVVTALFPDGNGTLWVGTDGGGLNALDPGEGTVVRFSHEPDNGESLSNNSVSTIFRDRSGVLWVGTDGGGLNRFDERDNTFSNIRNNPDDPWSLSDDRVLSLYEDRSGMLWVGTYGGGVDRFGRDAFKFAASVIQPADSSDLSHHFVRAFTSDPAGFLWVGTEGGGLARIHKTSGELSHFRTDPSDPGSISSNDVFSLHQARDGSIWVGTGDGVLNHFDPETESFQRSPVPVPAQGLLGQTPVRGIHEDVRGRIWVGTDGGGLHAYTPQTQLFQSFYHNPDDPGSLSSNRVYLIYPDRTGTLWIPTLGAGLNRFNPEDESITRFRNDPDDPTSVASDYLLAVLQDSSGDLWVGADGGLSKMDVQTGKFTNYYREHGLPNDVLYGILEDRDGFLWMSHNAGIARFDPRAEAFKNYDILDGLQSNEFNGGAFYESPEGEFFFGGIAGYNAFFPETIRDNPDVPPVVITSFDLFNNRVHVGDEVNGRVLLNQTITETDTLILSHADYVISFQFAGLSFAVPEKNQYAYMLEGLDKEWNDSRGRRYASYAKLPAGWYTFRVKASNNDGVWNEEGTSLVIRVNPPWWATWWARGLGAGILALGAIGAFWVRIRNISRRNRILEREVATRTAHLEKTLKELKQTKDQLVETAHKAGMAEIATGVLHNVGNVLNSVATSNSVIQGLLRESKAGRLGKANGLLREKMEEVDGYFSQDPKGMGLARYYLELERAMEGERTALVENADRMAEGVKVITDVIAAQQTKAKGGYLAENVSLKEVAEDSLKMVFPAGKPEFIDLETRYDEVPSIYAQKSKLIHVLVNLVKNARDSFLPEDDHRVLTLEIGRDRENAFIRVSDTGRGISPENLKQVFTLGFTTKANGHGFGLHSCANYMMEMGGRIQVASEGEGKGASFTINLPLKGKGARTAETTLHQDDEEYIMVGLGEPAVAVG